MKLDLSSFSFVELGASSASTNVIGGQRLHSLSAIVTTAHRKEEDIYTQALCECEGDGDGTTLTRKVRSLLVDSLLHRLRG